MTIIGNMNHNEHLNELKKNINFECIQCYGMQRGFNINLVSIQPYNTYTTIVSNVRTTKVLLQIAWKLCLLHTTPKDYTNEQEFYLELTKSKDQRTSLDTQVTTLTQRNPVKNVTRT